MKFVAVGNLTNDVLSTGLVPGGSSLYAALAARALGAEARIVSSHGDDFTGGALLAGVDVVRVPAARTTCFENVYQGGKRRQRVLARGGRVVVPGGEVVFACPVAGEIDVVRRVGDTKILGAGLQGWLRAIGDDGTVSPRPLGDVGFLTGCDALFVSDEDLGDARADATRRLCDVARIVVVTEGARGAIVHVDGRPHRVHAHPAAEVDPTGAGDVFATAFLLTLARGRGPLEAGATAACAASIVVEAHGAAGLHALTQLDARIAWYRVNVPPPTAV